MRLSKCPGAVFRNHDVRAIAAFPVVQPHMRAAIPPYTTRLLRTLDALETRAATFMLGVRMLDALVARHAPKTTRVVWRWCMRSFGAIHWFVVPHILCGRVRASFRAEGQQLCGVERECKGTRGVRPLAVFPARSLCAMLDALVARQFYARTRQGQRGWSGAGACGRLVRAVADTKHNLQKKASSSILVVHDGSTDIPAGVGAVAMMNLGMLEALFPLPPDLSMIDSCFTIVPTRQHADLILSLESLESGENLRVESLDPFLRDLSCHVTYVDWNESSIPILTSDKQLSDANWLSLAWDDAIISILRGRGLEGYLTGTVVQQPNATFAGHPPSAEEWRLRDGIAKQPRDVSQAACEVPSYLGSHQEACMYKLRSLKLVSGSDIPVHIDTLTKLRTEAHHASAHCADTEYISIILASPSSPRPSCRSKGRVSHTK
ncbi:hypothetical protein GGX14DRAFT_578570 [Mycena pura]|uniref:Uncharacterized protein n=1 Tax=Mycena pura TaxID=153505 RepID=A0AAD6UPT3_9AGAR|nr:hypothetical protein GGX14DRAFT_578570 [Mycena pura]